MKKCRKCGVVKSYDQFNKDKKSKDNLQYLCKECIKQTSSSFRVKEGIGVYGLWNKLENCWDYIGEGKLKGRETYHKSATGQSTPDEVKLNIWFDDWENVYEFRVLCKCETKQQCKDIETKYINELNPRYNIRKRQHKIA